MQKNFVSQEDFTGGFYQLHLIIGRVSLAEGLDRRATSRDGYRALSARVIISVGSSKFDGISPYQDQDIQRRVPGV